MSHAHEFGADQGLDGGEAEGREGDAMRLQDGGFQIGQGGETDIQISRDDEEFFHFIDDAPTDGFRCRGSAGHLGSSRAVIKRSSQITSLVLSSVSP